jgi:succinoglycan biosynthesis transport protein ExoP
VEDAVDLRKYLAIIRRWWWLVVICALLAAGTTYFVSSRKTPVYRATATLLVQSPSSSQTAEYQFYRYADLQAPTYIQMLTGQPVMEAAIAQLGWDNTSEPAGSVSAELIPNTHLIRVSAVNTAPARAAALANAVVNAFIAKYEDMQQGRYAEALATLQAQMDEVSAQMDNVQAQIDALGTPVTSQEQADLNLLQTTMTGYRNIYTILVRDYEQMNLLAAQSADVIAVYEPAEVPTRPVRAATRRNTMLAGAVGTILAVGIVFVAEYLDDTIKTPDDVRRALGLSTLGAIGRLAEEDGELIATTRPLSPASESFRKLRTNIRFSGLDRPLKTLLVTSPNPTEGKSTAVANLSVVMAQAGLKVVALDADLRRPRLHQLLSLHPRGGLTESLLEGAIDGYVQPVEEIDGLFVLPAGDKPPNPAETLGSQRMRELLDKLGQQMDMVVVDSPPVLPVTDAAVLAQGVDGVLLVIDVGETRRRAAQQAVEEIRQVGGKLIGVMLNKVPTHRRGYYYYYHYNYYSDGSKKKKKRRRHRRQKGLLGTMRRVLSRRQKEAETEGLEPN